MEKKELIKKVLELVSCATSRQISVLAKVRFNEDISAGSVGGILRTMAAAGQVGGSRNEHNAMVYWLIDEEA